MEHETERMLAQSRLTLPQYLSIMQKSPEEYRKELEPDALQRVKRDLVLSAIADAEGIAASEDEVREWLDNLNAISGDRPIRFNQLTANQRANIDGRIRRDKALARLIDIATEGRGDIILPDLSEFAEETDDEDEDEDAGGADVAERGAVAAAAAGAALATEDTEDTEDVVEDASDAGAEATSEARTETENGAATKASAPESTGDAAVSAEAQEQEQ